MLGDDVPELPGDRRIRIRSRLQHHEAPDRLALQGMRDADRRGFRHHGVRCERALDLGRAETLPRDRQRVVGAPVQEPEPVLVAGRPVAVHPDPREPPPVRVEVALGIAPDPPGHRRPRLPADELPHLPGPDRRALGVDDVDIHPEGGTAERARLQLGDRERREEARTHFGPTAQVDDRQRPPADLPVEPQVRIRVPGLPGRGEDPERRQVVAADRVRARRDQRADQGRRNAERGDAVPFHERPEPVGGGVRRRAVEQQHGRAERERADDLPRAHDPAEVGDPVEHLAAMQVDLVRDLRRDLHEEPAVDVEHALRTPGRPARVPDEQRMLALEGLRRQRIVGLGRDELRPVPLARSRAAADTAQHDGLADGPGAGGGGAGHLGHRHRPPLPREGVGREEHLHVGVRQAHRDRVRAEPAEDRDPDRSELRTRHHRGDGLRQHREEDPDRVAGSNPQTTQGTGEAIGLTAELSVGPGPRLPLLPLPDHRRCVGGLDGPPIDACVGEVASAAAEPRRPLDPPGDVEHLLVRLEEAEVQVAHDRVPEPGDVLDRAGDELLVGPDPVRTHEPSDVGPLDVLGRR